MEHFPVRSVRHIFQQPTWTVAGDGRQSRHAFDYQISTPYSVVLPRAYDDRFPGFGLEFSADSGSRCGQLFVATGGIAAGALAEQFLVGDGFSCHVRCVARCGFLMVIYLAGLQAIPEVLYEAAAIDGASQLQRIRYITLPLISPTAFFAIIISIIGAAQVFDNVWVLTGGGPGDATRLIVLYVYEIGFKRFEMGYAAAVSLTLFAILVVLTLLQFRLSRRWVHYD